jgi:hypothetical protein
MKTTDPKEILLRSDETIRRRDYRVKKRMYDGNEGVGLPALHWRRNPSKADSGQPARRYPP